MICPFCTITKDPQNQIIFETDHFLFVYDKFPIMPGHALLIPKQHVLREIDLPKAQLLEYWKANEKAYAYISTKHTLEPLTFVNPPQQQSITHLHKHFIPGCFGVLGVDKALRQVLRNKA